MSEERDSNGEKRGQERTQQEKGTPGRFGYVRFDEQAAMNLETFKSLFMAIEGGVQSQLGSGRAASLALTRLEEAFMWIGKALRDDQIARDAVPPTRLDVPAAGGNHE